MCYADSGLALDFVQVGETLCFLELLQVAFGQIRHILVEFVKLASVQVFEPNTSQLTITFRPAENIIGGKSDCKERYPSLSSTSVKE